MCPPLVSLHALTSSRTTTPIAKFKTGPISTRYRCLHYCFSHVRRLSFVACPASQILPRKTLSSPTPSHLGYPILFPTTPLMASESILSPKFPRISGLASHRPLECSQLAKWIMAIRATMQTTNPLWMRHSTTHSTGPSVTCLFRGSRCGRSMIGLRRSEQRSKTIPFLGRSSITTTTLAFST